MMRHVSMFRLKPEYRTPETVSMLEQALKALPSAVPEITACEIGVKPFPIPSGSPDGKVLFYDLIQIITFADEAGCASYPASQGHRDFLTMSGPYMEQVVGIDYPV